MKRQGGAAGAGGAGGGGGPGSIPRGGWLDWLERLGNKLPDPVFLFVGAAALVMVLSALGAWAGWEVQPKKPQFEMVALVDGAGAPVIDAESGQPKMTPRTDPETGKPVQVLVDAGDPVTARSLLSAAGLEWAITNMVANFMAFPPLGVVLVSMLGIGVAEHTGLFGAAMRWMAGAMPRSALTPTVVFLGIASNVASDAGYIVLPPLAAALYLASGRPPLAGIAAAFAGVSAGFSANLMVSAGDAILAEISTTAAAVLDPGYEVNALGNWYLMMASTFLLTALGWWVTAKMVEPRLMLRAADQGGPLPPSAEELEKQKLTGVEVRGLRWALIALGVTAVLTLLLIVIPGAPLHGAIDPTRENSAGKWTKAIVPIIFAWFFAPGLAYGLVTGTIRNQRDIAGAFIHAMSAMGPIIALAFFAAQFIKYLDYSRLDKMLAFVGGEALVSLGLPVWLLMAAMVVLSAVLNLFLGSMSAKWLILAPIVVPMLMMVGVSPEASQAAYRIGDSVTNIITPLNSYILVILIVVQRYSKGAGLGSLIALMMPYSIVFGIVWTLFFLLWTVLGLPLGVDGPLEYVPSGV